MKVIFETLVVVDGVKYLLDKEAMDLKNMLLCPGPTGTKEEWDLHNEVRALALGEPGAKKSVVARYSRVITDWWRRRYFELEGIEVPSDVRVRLRLKDMSYKKDDVKSLGEFLRRFPVKELPKDRHTCGGCRPGDEVIVEHKRLFWDFEKQTWRDIGMFPCVVWIDNEGNVKAERL